MLQLRATLQVPEIPDFGRQKTKRLASNLVRSGYGSLLAAAGVVFAAPCRPSRRLKQPKHARGGEATRTPAVGVPRSASGATGVGRRHSKTPPRQ